MRSQLAGAMQLIKSSGMILGQDDYIYYQIEMTMFDITR
jgi:hypothetical protein